MRVLTDDTVTVGWLVSQVRPPQLATTFVVKGTYRLHAGRPATAAGVEPELLAGDVHWDDDPAASLKYASDFAPHKPRCDVLLAGTAHAPGGAPTPGLTVRVSVGGWAKSLEVVGDRPRESGSVAPARFTSLPLRYERAAGGPGDAGNPVGRGRHADPPNIDHPRPRGDAAPRPAGPAGFGPLAAAWAPRSSRLGTYDANWLKTRWPWFPADFDWGHFNAAPRDQQLDAPPRGDEEVVLENLHPKHPVFRTRLPGVRARCFFTEQAPGQAARFREVPLRLDTVWINPDEEKLILVWRGAADVRTLKAREIQEVYACTEPLAEPPRSATHYQVLLLDLTTEKDDPAEQAREAEVAAAWAEFDRDMAQMRTDFAALDAEAQGLIAEADAALADLPGQIAADGMPAEYLNTPAAPGPGAVREELADMAASMPKSAPIDLGPHAAAIGGMEAAEQTAAQQAEKEQEIDRVFAANFPEDVAWTREAVAAAARRGDSLAGQDLETLDLSALDLRGVNLAGARLRGANLAGAILAGANLADADLRKADLTAADLTRANLDDADLKEAVAAQAKFAGASLAGATFAKLNLAGVDFTGCRGRAADFSGAQLAGARFADAQLPQADFSGSNLARANFQGAQLPAAQFEGIEGPGIILDGADITGIHASDGCNFQKGSFKKAVAGGAIFEEARLDDADFSRARLPRAQFSDASLARARFDRADLVGAAFDDAGLRQAQLTNANLLRANFERADLTDADFQGSNLYEAGFWEARVERTNFRAANLKGTTLG